MTNFRAMIAVAAAVAFAGSQAVAADGTLAPGKPAGVEQAARHSPNMLLIGGAAALVAGGVGLAIALSGSNTQCTTACNNTVVSTVTTS